MNTWKFIGVFFAFLLILSCNKKRNDVWVASAPAGKAQTTITEGGETVIPNGRIITPAGHQIKVAPHPYGLTLSPDGNIAITANSGVRPFSISIIRDIMGENPQVQQIPEGAATDEGILAAVFMGLAVSSNNELVYVGGGQEGKVFIFNVNTGERVGVVDCNTQLNGRKFEDSYIGDLKMSQDGSLIYAVDQSNFRLVILDVSQRKLIASVDVGRYPFGITLSPDGSKVYVANVGLYEYSKVIGVEMGNPGREGLKFPPFAYRTEEAEKGIEIDGYQVPGLGKANVPESFSVWTIDVADNKKTHVVSKIKTGILVGQMVEDFPAVGGASPNSLVATKDRVYVSNGNNDCISVIDVNQDTVVKNIYLRLDKRLAKLRGVIPFGLALSPDDKRLYVAEAGINAVAVIDLKQNKVLGHIPVGWFPSKLQVSRDGKKLIVANAKGFGSGPNGGPDFEIGPEGSYIGNLMNGVVSVLDIPDDKSLKELTKQVIENNFKFEKVSSEQFDWRKENPIPLYPREKESPIKHLVFITKENRTFDEVFGGLENATGEPSLARYGAGVSFNNRKGNKKITDATVMVNHLALAKEFAISDNFYCDSDVSADGHRWLVGTYPNEWVETSVAASYGGGKRMKLDSPAPGVLAYVGASGAVYPEDYNEAGSIWDHFDRYGIDFFNFGLGFEFAPGIETQQYKYTGIRLVINYPMPAPLLDKTSKIYATYNMNIPDQFRVNMFIKEFKNRWIGEGKNMPSVLTVFLPNDHGDNERPDDGYPFRESYMADNDLGLGRIVEFLSHTPYWKNMAIVVTEDDPQGGVDHVDAHRSLLMVISPYVKKNYVSHIHYSFGSIMKTFWHILGLPYLNQYDAGATDLADFFTNEPDLKPYSANPVDKRIFDPQKALDPLDENFDWKSLKKSPKLDHPETMQKWMREDDKKREEIRK
jgi:YVTN family beta-propeller protein